MIRQFFSKHTEIRHSGNNSCLYNYMHNYMQVKSSRMLNQKQIKFHSKILRILRPSIWPLQRIERGRTWRAKPPKKDLATPILDSPTNFNAIWTERPSLLPVALLVNGKGAASKHNHENHVYVSHILCRNSQTFQTELHVHRSSRFEKCVSVICEGIWPIKSVHTQKYTK